MRKLTYGLMALFLLQLGASAPKSSRSSGNSSAPSQGGRPQSSLGTMASPQAVGDQIAKFLGGKTGKELMMDRARQVAGAGAGAGIAPAHAPVAEKPPVRPSGPSGTVLKPGYVPPPPVPRASVSQIRQEIQKIFELNTRIKSVESGRLLQLQRVQDQARIHQRILNELDATQKHAEGQKASAKSALLAQEKLRIIHEETLRNAQAIEGLKEAPAGAVPAEAPTPESRADAQPPEPVKSKPVLQTVTKAVAQAVSPPVAASASKATTKAVSAQAATAPAGEAKKSGAAVP